MCKIGRNQTQPHDTQHEKTHHITAGGRDHWSLTGDDEDMATTRKGTGASAAGLASVLCRVRGAAVAADADTGNVTHGLAGIGRQPGHEAPFLSGTTAETSGKVRTDTKPGQPHGLIVRKAADFESRRSTRENHFFVTMTVIMWPRVLHRSQGEKR
jgi:hypothetical protein